MDFLVRTARNEDYEELLGLLKQLHPEDPIAAQTGEAFEEILASDHFEIIVAEYAGQLIGSCYLNIVPNLTRGGRPYSVIENVITDSKHRNKGVGKAVMDRALEISKSRSCYKVMLMSGRKDDAVDSFYQSCGFDGNQKQAYINRLD